MGKKLIPLILALILLLSACGGKETNEVTPERPSPPSASQSVPEPEDTATPVPTPEPAYTGPVNPLSGEPIGEE